MRYFGGKYRLAPWIISHFPDHRTYVEPFAGSASVLLAKPRCRIEVLNDLDGEIVNLFRVLRTPPQARQLRRLAANVPYARAEFDRAYEASADPAERALRLLIRSHFGVSTAGALRRTGFSAKPGMAQGWVRWRSALPAFVDRMQGVTVEQRPAIEVMQRFDGVDTLHYVDPPYVLSTRISRARTYRHEMDEADHVALLDALQGLQGTVLLSGYAHPLYAERLAGWGRVEHQERNAGGRATTEMLWIKPAGLGRPAGS